MIHPSILIKWFKAFTSSIFTLLDLDVTSKILFSFEIESLLLKMTMLLLLPALLATMSLFLTKLLSALISFVERFFSKILETCLTDVYALSQSLLLTHTSLISLIYKLLISLNSISQGSKNSEYSIVLGGVTKVTQQTLNVGSTLIYVEITSRRRSTWYPRWFNVNLSTLVHR